MQYPNLPNSCTNLRKNRKLFYSSQQHQGQGCADLQEEFKADRLSLTRDHASTKQNKRERKTEQRSLKSSMTENQLDINSNNFIRSQQQLQTAKTDSRKANIFLQSWNQNLDALRRIQSSEKTYREK